MTTSRSIPKTLQISVANRIGTLTRVVTPVGWVMGAAGVVLLVVGHELGWVELTTMAVVLLVLLLGSVAFALGQTDLDVTLELRPSRVTAGHRAAAQVTVASAGRHRLPGVRMELRVGDNYAEFWVPSLAANEEHEEPFVLPTLRRGVITVGPAASVRSDPFGILRRTQVWTEEMELIVHPRLVRLAELGTGFIRDLEGRPTNDRSDSDVAFHTLRAYEVGDDERHIHWFSTARTGVLMVRQFIDSRRSHVGLVVDGELADYANEAEFETAISVAASFGGRVLVDDQQVSCVVGSERVPSPTRIALLDGLAIVEPDNRKGSLGIAIAQLIRTAPGLSLTVVVTGARTSITELRRTALQFPPNVRVMMLRIDAATPTSFQPLGTQLLLSLRSIDELSHLMWSVAS